MLDRFSLRLWFLCIVIAVVGLLGAALYFEHVLLLDPCPLCIFQRVAFMAIGVSALLAAIVNPTGVGRWVFSGLVMLGSFAGMALAGRHIYLQNLPADEVPDCGPGLNYMLETLPFTEVLSKVLGGDGECAVLKWSFLGLSMPTWTFIWYLGFAMITLWLTVRQNRLERLN